MCRSVLLIGIIAIALTLAEGTFGYKRCKIYKKEIPELHYRIEGQAEIQDGYLHVVFDLKDALGGIKHKRGIDFGLGRGYSGSQVNIHK